MPGYFLLSLRIRIFASLGNAEAALSNPLSIFKYSLSNLSLSACSGTIEAVAIKEYLEARSGFMIFTRSNTQFMMLAVMMVCFSWLTVSHGQDGTLFEKEEFAEEKPWYHISHDRNLTRKMNTVVEFGEKDRPLEAAVAMQAVIEHQSDYFLESDEHRSTRQFLRSWVEQQPKDVLNAYEVQYGPAAANLLKQFQATGQRSLLIQVVQKYLHTKTGTAAAYRLACLEFDEGRFLAAAMNFERLAELTRISSDIKPWLAIKSAFCWMKLGRKEHAEQIIRKYEARHPETPFLIAGKQKSSRQLMDMFAEQIRNEKLLQPSARKVVSASNLSDWPMFRRTSSRNKLPGEFNPLPLVQWNIDLVPHLLPDDLPQKILVQEMLANIFKELERDRYTTLPAWNPILDDQKIIVSAFGTVAAFSLEDGRLLWKSSTHDHVLEYLQSEELLSKLTSQSNGGLINYEQYLIQQVAADLTTGTLSSDGNHVFAVRECGKINASSQGFLQAIDDISIVPNHANRLSAFNLKSGRLLWEVGGLFGGQSQEYSGHYFLGPPVIVAGNAYLLSESGGQVFLSEINSQTGAALWMQPLAIPESEILFDGPRRLSGSSPAFHDPFLICATNAGTVIAVDLEAKELRWVYSYKQKATRQENGNPLAARQSNAQNKLRPVSISSMVSGSHWQEFTPLVSGNYLLLTPADSEDLICLDLITGKLLWSELRRDGLYIDVVKQKNVLIIGKQTLRSLSLKHGVSNWPQSVSIPSPSGRGVARGDVYQLPTQHDGLHSYDVVTGALLATTEAASLQTTSNKPVPSFQTGNLIVTQDQLVTIGNGRLTALQPLHKVQAEIKQKLLVNPKDAATLSRMGQLALHRGEVKSGLSLLQQSYRIKQLPETARQITKTILNADQIVLNDQEIADLAEMMVAAEHSTEIVFRYVQALQQHHKSLEALLVLRTLVATPQRASFVIPVSAQRRVRADSLAAGIVKDIFISADQVQLQKLRTELTNWFKQATDAEHLLALKPFAADQQLSEQFRVYLIRKLDEQQSFLELERHLLWLRKNGSEQQRAEATARLARMLLNSNKTEEAAIYLNELATKYRSIESLEQLTGEELIVSWKKKYEQLKSYSEEKFQGLVLDKQYKISVQPEEFKELHTDRLFEIEATHPAGSTWEFWNFQMTQKGPHLVAQSPTDKTTFTVSLEGKIKPTRNYTIQTEGHLGLLCCEGYLTGFDSSGNVLWNENLGEVLAESNTVHELFPGPTALVKSYGEEIGQLTPINDHKFACRLGSKIYLKHAVSGNVLWEYETDSQYPLHVWIDDRRVYVINPNNRRILPLRLEDGKPGKLTQFPPHQQILAFQGNVAVLFNKVNPEKGILTGYDFTKNITLWNQAFSTSISVATAGNGLLALHDIAQKKLLLLNPILENPVLFQVDTPQTTQSKLFIHSDPAHWYFHLTVEPEIQNRPPDYQSVQNANGPVIAISKQTNKIIWTRNINKLRWITNQPAALPFLVYGALVSGHYVDDNGKEQTGYVPRLLLIHKQTGKELAGTPKGFTGLLLATKNNFTTKQFKFLFRTGTILVEEKPDD